MPARAQTRVGFSTARSAPPTPPNRHSMHRQQSFVLHQTRALGLLWITGCVRGQQATWCLGRHERTGRSRVRVRAACAIFSGLAPISVDSRRCTSARYATSCLLSVIAGAPGSSVSAGGVCEAYLRSAPVRVSRRALRSCLAAHQAPLQGRHVAKPGKGAGPCRVWLVASLWVPGHTTGGPKPHIHVGPC